MGGRLNFEIDTELEPSLVTARAGIPSLIEAFRQRCGGGARCERGSSGASGGCAVRAGGGPVGAVGGRRRALRGLRPAARGRGVGAAARARACRRRRRHGTFSRRSTRPRPPLWQGERAAVPGEARGCRGWPRPTGGWWPGCRSGRRRRWRRSTSMRRSSRARSGRALRPMTGGPATSRWWRCGPSRTWCWPTSSATATSRPAPATGGVVEQAVAALPPGVDGDSVCAATARSTSTSCCAGWMGAASATGSAPT